LVPKRKARRSKPASTFTIISSRSFHREALASQRGGAGMPLPEFRKFYYELAQGNTPRQIEALLKMVPVSQVMYGTDFRYRDGAEVNAGIAAYGFSAGDIPAVERDNALKLLPRVKASQSVSRTRCSVQRCCKMRDPGFLLGRVTNRGPGSASHHLHAALRPGHGLATPQLAMLPQLAASCSAPRSESAKMVKVGLEAPQVGKIPGPAT
jgi:hypothetical protein